MHLHSYISLFYCTSPVFLFQHSASHPRDPEIRFSTGLNLLKTRKLFLAPESFQYIIPSIIYIAHLYGCVVFFCS